MSRYSIEARMDAMGIKATTTINSLVVTRWTTDSFEIGTIGKNFIDRDEAIERIKNA